MNRRDAGEAIRKYLGARLVHHNTWSSRYNYSGRPQSGSVSIIRQVGHHNGRTAQLPRIQARAADLGSDKMAEIEQIKRVDHQHFVINGWTRGFAYSLGAGPLTGNLYEARSGWWAHGAHLGDRDKTDFALYQALGLDDEQMTEAQVDAHFTVAEMLVELFGMGRHSQTDHGNVAGNATACAGLYRGFITLDRRGQAVPGPYPVTVIPTPEPPPEGEQVITQLPTLRQSWFGRGDSRNAPPSDAVRRLQSLLAIAGVIEFTRVNFPDLPVSARSDGLFGPSTAEAVRAFQRSNGLQVDGVVGAFTWTKLLGV